jgi:hypothetical protein
MCIDPDRPVSPHSLDSLIVASGLLHELQVKAEAKKEKRKLEDAKQANEEKERLALLKYVNRLCDVYIELSILIVMVWAKTGCKRRQTGESERR